MLSCTLSLPSGVTVEGGLWKLNCSLLEDEEVVREYREHFNRWQTLQDFFDSRAQWWEMVKERTRQFFKKRGVELKRVNGGEDKQGGVQFEGRLVLFSRREVDYVDDMHSESWV
ncbi:hypothetical protein F2P79_024651 [Pimephales promelas]|nr:hypothetical protein F2P79_024651 [Pimephales promelas]